MSSLRARLSLRVALGILAVVGLGAFLAYRTGARILTAQFDANLRTRMAVWESLMDQEGDEGELDKTGERLLFLSRTGPAEYAQFWDLAGESFYRSPDLGDGDLPLRVGTVDEPAIWNAELPNGRPGRWIGARTPIRSVLVDRKTGEFPAPIEVYLVVAIDRSSLDRFKALLLTGIVTAGAMMVLVAAGITWLAVARGLGPLHEFGERVRRMDITTGSAPFEGRAQLRELRPIAAGLDELHARVDATLRREKRLSATIAHEFRTPFAELRAMTEVALQDVEDLEFSRQALEQVHAISIRLAVLLDLIRALTDLERRKGELVCEELDVASIVDQALAPHSETIAQKRLVVTKDGLCGLSTRANRAALTSICTNFLNNAVEYCPDGEGIRCSSVVAGDSVVLRFENPCVDLSAEHVVHLTEPFWRGSRAREDPDRHGLGLNISKGMARLAGFELSFDLDGDTFTAEVSIPKMA